MDASRTRKWTLFAGVLYFALATTLAIRTYSSWARLGDYDALRPAVILAGQSEVPFQYRALHAVLSQGLGSLMRDPKGADTLTVSLSVLFCYVLVAALLTRETRHWYIAGTGLVLFHVCVESSLMVWRFRDTFFDIGLAALVFWIATSRKPNSNAVVATCAVNALNRETSVFALVGIAADKLRRRREPSRRDGATSPTVGWWTIGFAAIAAGVMQVAIRSHFGFQGYPSRGPMEFLTENVDAIVPWRDTKYFLLHGFWTWGAGLGLLCALSFLAGNRFYVGYLLGSFVPLLMTGFLFGHLSEYRIFGATFPIVAASLTAFLDANLGESSPPMILAS